MRIFRPVPTTKRLNETNDLPSLLKTNSPQCRRNKIRKQWVGCDDDMPSWHQYLFGQISPTQEELNKACVVRFFESCEPWKRASLRSVE